MRYGRYLSCIRLSSSTRYLIHSSPKIAVAIRNSESVNQNLPGLDAAAKNAAISIVGVYDVTSFRVSMFRKSVTPVSIGYSSHSIWLPPHEMVNKPRLSPESIP